MKPCCKCGIAIGNGVETCPNCDALQHQSSIKPFVPEEKTFGRNAKELMFRTSWIAFKPQVLILFFVAWNLAFFTMQAILMTNSDFFGIHFLVIAFLTAFLASLASAPLLSNRLRVLLCSDKYDFETAKRGLFGLAVFASACTVGLLSMYFASKL